MRLRLFHSAGNQTGKYTAKGTTVQGANKRKLDFDLNAGQDLDKISEHIVQAVNEVYNAEGGDKPGFLIQP
ncbi:hypothetical protein SAMN05660649_02776 [Desulfotomaculum arcticum]|uniref:Uncharacterized protein n=1 Tax=Desulfotruncus arcticus DSM 17038 TaxID=1121424 RepID=A0A1I2UWF7_9FIRM|nr:hypothetical protein SAMN05660649_02776 [Desulfotomaculum arcticum] [Desulfotruncus arcticus DSM 17038]